MASRPQLPPPGVMIPELRTPNPSDVFFRELVARDSPRWVENNPIKRGTLYSSLIGSDAEISELFPNLYFLSETVPIGSNTVAGMTQDEFVVFNWSTAFVGESPTNAEISYLADAVTNPVFARVYTVRRSVYEAAPTIATGTPFTGILGAKALNLGTGYTHATCTLVGGTGGRVTPVIADGRITHYVVEDEGEGFSLTSTIEIIGDGVDASALLLIQPVGAILTSQKKIELANDDPRQAEFVKVLRVYELLPGPWVPFTRHDDNIGPVQGRRRAVLNTGQLGGTVTATGKTNYEGRDGSSIVSIELQERWSDGTGSDANNRPYPVFEWSTYTDERGTVGHFRQVVVSNYSGNNATLIRSGPTKLIKTWFEPFEDNPFLVFKFIDTWNEVVVDDIRMGSEHGGGYIGVTERTAAPGAQLPDVGLLVVESSLRTKSPNEQTKHSEFLYGLSAWPINHGMHTDEVTGIVLPYTKQVIDAGTPYPGRSGYRGPFVEDQPYDRWKTIRIITSVDLSTLPGPEAWYTTCPLTLPPRLLSVEAVWTDVKSKLTKALAEKAHVKVSSGSGGSCIIRSSGGFRGQARAIQARDYRYGSPLIGDVPVPYKIIPSSGSVVFTATDSATEATNWADGGVEFGDNFRIGVNVTDIRDHLVGAFTILNDEHTSPPQSAIAIGGGSVAGVSALGTPATMTVSIPQSTPAVLASGTQILVDVDVREWRAGMGVWIIDRIYAIIP